MFCCITKGLRDQSSYKGTAGEAKGVGNVQQGTEICRGGNGFCRDPHRICDGQNNSQPPAASIIPASLLDSLPHRDISNGIVSAKAYIPGPGGFYRGTRFDRAGVDRPCHL